MSTSKINKIFSHHNFDVQKEILKIFRKRLKNEKYKIYLLNRIISVHKGFSVYNDYSIYKKDYFLRLKSFIKNFKLDKYYLINLFCDLIINFIFNH